MKRTGRPTVILSFSEKALLERDLDTIEGRCTALEEVLTVAAWRSQTNLSEWTETRLQRLRGAAADLRTAIGSTLVDGD